MSVEDKTFNEERLLIKISRLFEEKFKDLPKKEDFDRLKGEIAVVLNENENLKCRIANLEKQNEILCKNVENLMRKSKNKNLVFKGLPASDGNDVEGKIRELCITTFGIQEPKMGRIYDLGKNIFVVEFMQINDVYTILHNAKKLKNTGIWVSRDLTYEQR
uniref:Uncharacterized protein n=1 Tax=Rhodnius prolixus TaxID=13249 RepID=T1HEW3_RHOPR